MNTQEYHSYSKIYNLSHREVEGYLTEECIVEEKIDGSQFSFGLFDGEVRVFSKNKEIMIGDVPKLFAPSVEAILIAHNRKGLVEGWTYRGEAMRTKQHNTLEYERVPNNHVIIFEIDTGYQNLLDYENKRKEAERLEFETVPILYIGMVTQDVLNECLKKTPYLGGQFLEGVVIKRLRSNTLYGVDKKVLFAKFVSNEFKERHIKEWNKDKVNRKDIPTIMASQFSGEARYHKALQRLRDSDGLVSEDQNILRNIPLIINEVWKDIEEEELDTIKRQLYNQFKNDIRKQCVKGIPNWYKSELEKDIQFA